MQRRDGPAHQWFPEYDRGHDGGSADWVEVFEGAALYYDRDSGECFDVCGGDHSRFCGHEGGGFLGWMCGG